MAQLVPPAGPVDIAVVGFPDSVPDDRVTSALADAVTSGAVRVLDALVVQKSSEGDITIIDVEEPDATLDLLGYPADLAGLLSEADAAEVAVELPEGTSALVIAWENVWAVRLQQAISDAGGIVAVHDRIDPTAVAAAVEALLVSTDT